MAVTTRLTWLQEKILQNYIGEKRLSLLYKASVHGFCKQALLDRCCNQGPTLTVIYSGDHVIGAYSQMSYQQGKYAAILLFTLQGTKISKCETGRCTPEILFADENIQCNSIDFWINVSYQKVIMSLKKIENLGLGQNRAMSIQECEVFRCEDLLDERKMKVVTELRKSLLSALRTYEPYGSLVQKIRILLLGPIGAGKSSFFNSVRSVFQGHVTHQAFVGTNTTGTSEKFNPTKPITSSHHNYIDSPSLKDRIHCVAFVFDANSIEHFSSKMIAKIRSIRRLLIKYDMVHVALLTHLDNIDLITKSDLIEIDRCGRVKLKIEEFQRKLGFALPDILVVSNYSSEWELDPVKDVLILSALRRMLWAADDFLENLPLEQTGNQKKEIILKHEKGKK
ncbi:interferon-induced protein 44 isoform X2 [Sapajus apella]|uniref:Interferon-induced protein 44 isoform X2 n=1 Tax=Sapajus apella TaxID=9515 RepID=A0A6J3JE01_SAPAP|nr:interferon-induced protein 44 isoform X2 [Sapajus apella]